MARRLARWLALTGALLTATTHAGDLQAQRQLEALGQQLFLDQRLSRDGRVSCASCHQPARAFTDGRPVAIGVDGLKGTRNTPSLIDAGAQRALFWDGRRDSLEQQALDPLTNTHEHGLGGTDEALRILTADAGYVAAFQQAFGPGAEPPITAANVAAALAAFQRSLVDGPSRFDRFRQGEVTAVSAQAKLGWELFSGSAGCVRCHAAAGPRPLFTDHAFHTLGVGLQGVSRHLPELTSRIAKLHSDRSAIDHSVLNDAEVAALGRFVVTLEPKDIGAFKTPSLRNVALTAPYMHDGSVATLAQAVELEIYYRGTADGRPLVLTPDEKLALTAFLESLTGWQNSPYHAGQTGASPQH